MLRATRPERTIARTAEVRGVGFFHGADVTMRFQPAAPGTGIVFARSDLPGHPTVPARADAVVPSARRTSIRRGPASVEMIEHVMAALAGLHIDNCLIQIDAGECPGGDGSSRLFVEALDRAGTIEQDRARQAVVLDEPVGVNEGPAQLTAHPREGGLTLSYHLDYGTDATIPPQSFSLDLSAESFRAEIAPSRTFLLESEAAALRAAGIGRRTTPADLLIFGHEGVVGNTLRFPDECARHKVLDMLGDLALLGFDLHGSVIAHRSGHQTNHELVRRLLKRASSSGAALSQPSTPAAGLLDIEAIMRLLPHRYPFLLVDRVIELEPGRRATAVKNVTVNEPFFNGHWPGLPIMPGVLIVEAIAQAAGILIAASIKDRERLIALITSIDGVKLRRAVVPGDQLRLEVIGHRIKARTACVSGLAKVGDTLAAEAKLRFVMVGADRPFAGLDGFPLPQKLESGANGD
jgi:UDP-3-O-[3-hydroxymyristoyl] N-acetylglucosamine deacetylase / 3-hydroxyacyl-[acyl-carrier-protein] dehydratase